MICQDIIFFFFWHFSCLVFSEPPGPVFWCLTLIWGTSQSSLFQVVFLLSLLPVVLPFCVCCTFRSWLTFCGYSLLFFFLLNLCSLCFSVFKISPDTSLSSEGLSSALSSLQVTLSKRSPFLLQCVWSPAFSLILGLFSPQLTLSAVVAWLLILSIKALSIRMIFVLNSWSGSPNIPCLVWFWGLLCLFQLCFLSFTFFFLDSQTGGAE